jgi:hypothetical protein
MAFDEGAIEKIWSNLMSHLCPRHRIQARNGHPTDYRIEDLRMEHYPSYEKDFFRRHIVRLANRQPEIQVEGDVIRLTPYGLDNCGVYDGTWQRDF